MELSFCIVELSEGSPSRMRNRNLILCKEFAFFFLVRTTKMETSKLSFPAPAEAGIEISFHNDVAAGAVSAAQSAV